MNINSFICVLITAFLFAGCSSTREANDLHNSMGILYPVAKIGDGLAIIGTGVHSVATPGAWPMVAPHRFAERPTEEQLKEYDKVSVPYVDSIFSSQNQGAGIGMASFQDPLRSFLARVELIVGDSFDWRLNPNINDAAVSMPGGVIFINPVPCAYLSQNALLFTLLHEAGHQELGHVSGTNLIEGARQPWLRPQFELEADLFAATNMIQRANVSREAVVLAAMEIFGNSSGDGTHPPGYVRVAKIRAALGMLTYEMPDTPAMPGYPVPDANDNPHPRPMVYPNPYSPLYRR